MKQFNMMFSRSLMAIWLCLSWTPLHAAGVKPGPKSERARQVEAIEQWANLAHEFNAINKKQGKGAASGQDFVALADKYRDFPRLRSEQELDIAARRQEILCLTQAETRGYDGGRQRRKRLVETFVKESAHSPAARQEVAAYDANLEIILNNKLNEDERLSAHMAVAKNLIVGYPEAPAAYESYLAIALEHPPEKPRKFLSELLQFPHAPEGVRKAASDQLGRYNLFGIKPSSLLSSDSCKALFREGNLTVLCTWSSRNPAAIQYCEWLATHIAPEVRIVGINANDVRPSS